MSVQFLGADVIRLIGLKLSDADFVRFGATCKMIRRALESRLARIHYLHTIAADFTLDEWLVVEASWAKIMDTKRRKILEMLHDYVDFDKIDSCVITRNGHISFHSTVNQLYHRYHISTNILVGNKTEFQCEHPLLFSKRDEILRRVDAIFNNKSS